MKWRGWFVGQWLWRKLLVTCPHDPKCSCAQKPASLWNWDEARRGVFFFFSSKMKECEGKRPHAFTFLCPHRTPGNSWELCYRFDIVAGAFHYTVTWRTLLLSWLLSWGASGSVGQSHSGAQQISRALLVIEDNIITIESSVVSVFWPIVRIHVQNICWHVHNQSAVWTHPMKLMSFLSWSWPLTLQILIDDVFSIYLQSKKL